MQGLSRRKIKCIESMLAQYGSLRALSHLTKRRKALSSLNQSSRGKIPNISCVIAFTEADTQLFHLITVDKSLVESHLLRRGDAKSLPLLERCNEFCSF